MSHRLAQVNELIKQELGKLFLKEIDFPQDCLVTITKVETSKSLEHTNVWLSILPTDSQEKVFTILNKNIGHLQHPLNKTLVMRIVPKIVFKKDTTEQKAARIEELLNQISRKKGKN